MHKHKHIHKRLYNLLREYFLNCFLYLTNHLNIMSHFQICIDEFSLYQVLSQLTIKIAFTLKGVFEIMPINKTILLYRSTSID